MFHYMDDILCDLKVFFNIDDVEEELTSAQFFRMVSRLSAYKGAVRQQIELYAREHEEELKAMRESRSTPAPVTLSADQLRNSVRLGAQPTAGQLAPLFEVQNA